ncbi:uncharacterized protein LOC133180861 [Saccostrea echinata]|uniref:uncharacterized protein LOC133180861 n=1 Tax=Saccostrea echinata TaxID=191078 RepID=UPI002A81A8C3|nr:uncharacterized protein LOC133180861 [Saccostrea echinata]
MGALYLPCLILSLCMYETFGQVSSLQNKTFDKSGLMPSPVSGKASNVLRDILNQESLVRFSMVQRIQRLVMDAIDNKNDREVIKTKLGDVINELQDLEKKDQRIEAENMELNRELKTLDEKLKQINETLQIISVNNIVDRLAATEDMFSILSAFVNKSLEKAHEDLKESMLHWSQWTESRLTEVVFTAGITTNTRFQRDQTVIFPHVITNKGNAYNPANGVFTAPVNGTYVFFCSIISVGSDNSWVKIIKNGALQVVIGAYGSANDYDSSASNIVNLQLIKGDRVWVAGYSAAFRLYSESGNPVATFSGFLL